MDELALLKDFRLEDAAAGGAREHARAALQAAVARQLRRRQRTFVLVAFVAATILAGGAYGVVRELIVGGPAPEEVRQQPARFGHAAELIPVPHPDDPQLDQARVAAVLDSSVGTVYLFDSPNDRGLCASTWIEGDRGYQGRLNMTSACGLAGQSFFAYGEHTYRGNPLRQFFGHAGNGVTRVALRFGSRLVDVPLTGRWFLAELPEQPDEFLSYAADGRLLEHHAFLRRGPVLPRVERPHQAGEARELAKIEARDGSETISLSVARASDGGWCQIIRSERTSNSGCSVARPAADQVGVEAMNFGGAPDGVLLLVGPVGADIATLQLRYQDDRTANVPLRDGWALYEVERSDYAEGKRPDTLVGRDASGREIAAKSLPWHVSRAQLG